MVAFECQIFSVAVIHSNFKAPYQIDFLFILYVLGVCVCVYVLLVCANIYFHLPNTYIVLN